MSKLEKSLAAIIKYGLYLVLFTPVVFWNDLYFPAITAKAFFFQGIIEILFPLYLALAIMRSEYRPRRTPLAAVLAVFFAILIVTGVTGLNPYHSFFSNFERMWGIFFWLHLGVYFLMLSSVFKAPKDWRRLFVISVFAALFVSSFALWQRLQGLVPYGTIGNTAFMASYLLINVFFAWWLAAQTKNKWAYGLISAVMIAAFILANSRGAFVGLIAGLVFWTLGAIIFSKRWRRPLIISGLMAAIVFGILFFSRNEPWLADNPYFGRLFRISLTDPTAQTRLIAWRSAWEGFKERPLAGVGHENFNLVFNKHFNPEFYRYAGGDIWFDRAHNQPLDFLVNDGIFGFLSYLAIFGSAFYALFASSGLLRRFASRNDRKEGVVASPPTGGRSNLILVAGLFAYFIQNLFVFDSQSSVLGFFLLLGYLNFTWPAVAVKPFLAGSNGKSPAGAKLRKFMLMAITVPAVLAAVVAFIYLNIRPVYADYYLFKAGYAASAASAGENDGEIIGYYKKALSYDSFYQDEIRKFFAKFFIDRSLKGQPVAEPLLKENLPLVISEVEKNVAENPLDIYPLTQLVDLKVIQSTYAGDFDAAGAAETAQKMIDLNPKRAEGYFGLAQIQDAAGKAGDAVRTLEELTGLFPDYAEAHYRLSVAFDEAGRHEESAAELERACELGYNCESVHKVGNLLDLLKMADSAIESGELLKAVSFYEEAVVIAPGDYSLWAKLAAGYAEIGEYQKARDAANVVLKIAPPEYQSQIEQFLQSIEGR